MRSCPSELILHELPTSCNFPSTAPTRLRTTAPILQEQTTPVHVLTGCSSLSPPAPLWVPPHRLQLQPGAAPAGCPWAVPPSGFIHCCTMGSSMTAHGDLLLLVPMGYSETACSFIGPSWVAGNFCCMPGASPPILLHWSLCTWRCFSGFAYPP